MKLLYECSQCKTKYIYEPEVSYPLPTGITLGSTFYCSTCKSFLSSKEAINERIKID